MGFEENWQTRVLVDAASVRLHGEEMQYYLKRSNRAGVAMQLQQVYALLWVARFGTVLQKARAYFELCQFGRLRNRVEF